MRAAHLAQYATSDSIARLLLFGQAHVRCLGLLAESKRSRGVFSEWPKVLSVLKQLRRLEAIDLEIRRCPKEMAVFHVLRNFLPACIVWMESQWPIDFLLASPKLIPAENFADELLLQKARGWIVEDWAKETGIPSLSLESMIRLPHPIMHFGEYKRVFAAVTAYFDEFPDHELKTEDFDADLIEKYRFTWDKPVCLWTHWKNGNRSRFLLTYNLLEVY
ncbi:hypothetical protein M3Y99_00096100 [Aphelenchoides fujianensis]|nr:hypothetical protein M3Y99_00096100 [Aphelenchoides fujianensis]